MREVSFRRLTKKDDLLEHVNRSLQEIAHASEEDAMVIADGYTVTNFTASRTLDASTATASQIAHFLCTFIDDLKRRGPNRTS